jgi:hypothetical protein
MSSVLTYPEVHLLRREREEGLQNPAGFNPMAMY